MPSKRFKAVCVKIKTVALHLASSIRCLFVAQPTVWIVVGSLAIILIIPFIHIRIIHSYEHEIEYWNNYWNVIPVFAAAVPAILTFFYNRNKEIKARNNEREAKDKARIEEKENKDKIQYAEIQHEIVDVAIPQIAMFNKKYPGKLSTEERVRNLIHLLYEQDNLDAKISMIKNDDDSRIDGRESIEPGIKKIIQDPTNKVVVEIVSESSAFLEQRIKELQEDIRKDNKNTKDKITIANRILGFWILNFQNANNAKYLLGVATSDKRCVGAFRLHKSARSTENRRLWFHVDDGDIIYLEGVQENENSVGYKTPFPYLDQWTAQNPVLYYKSFINGNTQIEFTEEDMKHVMHILGVTHNEIEAYKRLGPRDIIIVRTYKFDQ
ncbi:hypothetical protein Q7Q91_13515 [Lactiplantibacillus pentosus]|uniref:hypothetical protein n=1 Tax=Lactiplantibacillus pentosus TaxID=1589 RepID=UPI002710F066|nr:hypothetical protein [Lactiplantibacillus pentosus]MDO7806004.1 hypothetical protein [Lactiplantibacillus pentosus]